MDIADLAMQSDYHVLQNAQNPALYPNTQPPPNAYTLAARLAQMLIEAETLFGPRDKSFTIVGLEFRTGNPHIFLPERNDFVAIRLSSGSIDNYDLLCGELAHEAIHCLSPIPGGAKVLEEGIAVWFARYYCQKHLNFAPHEPQNYAAWRTAYEGLHNLHADTVRLIRQSRQANLNAITADDIQAIVPRFPRPAAEALILPA